MPAPRKTTKAKKLAGTLRPDRDTVEVADAVASGNIEKPEGLSERESALWDHAVANAPTGVLAAVDQNALRAWTTATALANEAAEHIAAEGAVVLAPNKYKQRNPYVDIWIKANAAQARASQGLGFDPISRSKLKIEAKPEPEYNPFVQYSSEEKIRELMREGGLHPRNVEELREAGWKI
jgi:P27 family predicted phage terminase small subunit